MFNPDRFNHPEKIVKDTYFPFGLGPRICIGAGFAKQESTLLLASILRKYKLELKPNFTPNIKGRLTTRSTNGMMIKLIQRT
jgi:cytochrome P450